MTAREFVAKVQAYYGLSYPPGQQADLMRYLQDQSESRLSGLYEGVVRVHSAKWKCLPDIAVLESKETRIAAEEWLEREERRILDERRRNTMMITDGDYVPREEILDFLTNWQERMKEKAHV